MNLGAKIKELRKRNGMEQKDLAELLHISPKTVSSWEVNRTQPKMEFISQMCEIFHCRKSDFLEDNTVDIMVNIDDFDRILIENYHRADDIDRQLVNRILGIERVKEIIKKINEYYPQNKNDTLEN